MIIFGTRGITQNAGSGAFHCPTCQAEKPYRHKRVRRFFTLYFIPIIPLDLHGEYVECEACNGTYRMEVLEFDPAAGAAEFEAEFHRAMKRVMVEMMLVDGNVDDDEVEVIKRVYGDLTGTEVLDDDIRAEIVDAETRTGDIANALGALSGGLNNSGKEIVIKAAFLVAAADGVFQEEEKDLIASIAQALDMSNAHLNGILAEMQQEV